MAYSYWNNYNSNFPVGYPAQQYPAPMQTVPPVISQAPQSQGGGILWCQGEAGAKSYPVAPGGSVLLMDSEGSRFYIKSADPSGMPNPLRIFEFREVNAASAPTVSPVSQNAPDLSAFVTRDELDNEIDRRLTALLASTTNGGNTNGQPVT